MHKLTVVRASTRETLAIAHVLDEHCRKIEAGYCEYDTGWTDASVAAAVSPRLGSGHVAHIRKELYGNLRRSLDQTLSQVDTVLREQFVRLLKVLGQENGAVLNMLDDLPWSW